MSIFCRIILDVLVFHGYISHFEALHLYTRQCFLNFLSTSNLIFIFPFVSTAELLFKDDKCERD